MNKLMIVKVLFALLWAIGMVIRDIKKTDDIIRYILLMLLIVILIVILAGYAWQANLL